MEDDGRDCAGVWWSNDRRCAFAQRAQSVAAKIAVQPVLSHDRRFAITLDGQIYNQNELKEAVAERGIAHCISDAEALLQLYALEGAGMLKRLRGMFAFAIWDDLRRELFLARDPFGIRPLYYANDGWTFRFASRVKALYSGGNISEELEPAGVVGFYLWGHVPEPFTLYRDIRALPAGHTMLVDQLAPREPEPYARIVDVMVKAGRLANGTNLREQVRESVVDSVEHHLPTDVNLGAFLSGGTASGSLIGLMSEIQRRAIRAITIRFEEFGGTADDEVSRASEVAKLYGARHIVRYVGMREFQADLAAMVEAMDQPSVGGFHAWFLAKAAREQGLKIVSAGFGANATLGGSPSPRGTPGFASWYDWLSLTAIRRLAPKLTIGQRNYAARRPKPCMPLHWSTSDCRAYFARRSLFFPDEIPNIIEPSIAREGLRRLKLIRRLRASVTPDPGTRSARLLALESDHFMRDRMLRDIDWAARAHGIQIRTPFVDYKLLHRLAPALKNAKAGDVRAALARAPQLALPEQVANCPDSGRLPTDAWFQVQTSGYGCSKCSELVEWPRTVLNTFLPPSELRAN
jgi:asparagine synthase (glutamine-hydrolysing)